VGGYDLILSKEPSAQDVIDALQKYDDVSRIVFCGLGEPTTRIEVLLEVAKYLKTRGAHIRLNTNGQGSAYAGYDIAPKLSGLVDEVSISLNASTPQGYDALCRSIYGEEAYEHLLSFAKSCRAHGIRVVMSVVDLIGPDEVKKCRRIAEDAGATLRVRTYID
jgi:TatD DNase family protein